MTDKYDSFLDEEDKKKDVAFVSKPELPKEITTPLLDAVGKSSETPLIDFVQEHPVASAALGGLALVGTGVVAAKVTSMAKDLWNKVTPQAKLDQVIEVAHTANEVERTNPNSLTELNQRISQAMAQKNPEPTIESVNDPIALAQQKQALARQAAQQALTPVVPQNGSIGKVSENPDITAAQTPVETAPKPPEIVGPAPELVGPPTGGYQERLSNADPFIGPRQPVKPPTPPSDMVGPPPELVGPVAKPKGKPGPKTPEEKTAASDFIKQANAEAPEGYRYNAKANKIASEGEIMGRGGYNHIFNSYGPGRAQELWLNAIGEKNLPYDEAVARLKNFSDAEMMGGEPGRSVESRLPTSDAGRPRFVPKYIKGAVTPGMLGALALGAYGLGGVTKSQAAEAAGETAIGFLPPAVQGLLYSGETNAGEREKLALQRYNEQVGAGRGTTVPKQPVDPKAEWEALKKAGLVFGDMSKTRYFDKMGKAILQR